MDAPDEKPVILPTPDWAIHLQPSLDKELPSEIVDEMDAARLRAIQELDKNEKFLAQLKQEGHTDFTAYKLADNELDAKTIWELTDNFHRNFFNFLTGWYEQPSVAYALPRKLKDGQDPIQGPLGEKTTQELFEEMISIFVKLGGDIRKYIEDGKYKPEVSKSQAYEDSKINLFRMFPVYIEMRKRGYPRMVLIRR